MLSPVNTGMDDHDRVRHPGWHFPLIRNQLPRWTQPSTLCGTVKMCTSQIEVMLCGLGVKAGMVV